VKEEKARCGEEDVVMAEKLRRKAGMENSQPARIEEESVADKRKGVKVKRYFTRPGVHPFAEIDWEKRSAVISGEKGEVVFEQHDVEIPKSWSQLATNVVVSKYFRGPLGTPQREYSVRQLISRVVDTITAWGRKDGYFASEEDARIFADELAHLLVEQKLAFNSPVWFNVGVEPHPQCSACFILSVEDRMESILDWYRKEGIIFKGGSGSGVNLSKLRSSREQLAGGGTASGPVSFMRAADASAGVIKSGGKTRRAAKMVVLNVDHPDVIEFIQCKAEEERKAWTLIEAGYDASIDGAAYSSIFFQNANNSVRVMDDFMRAIIENRPWSTHFVTTGEVCETFQARDLLRRIAEATWRCGDPGMQFDTTINAWHTCPNTARINASNPCSEYMHLDDSACLGPEVRVSTKQGLLPVAEMYRRQEAGETIFVKTELLSEHAAVPRHGKRGYRPADVYARQLAFRPAVVIKTGRKLLYRIELSTGQTIRLTADHKVLTEEGWKEVRHLQVGYDAIVTQKQSTPIDYSEATPGEIQHSHMLGWMLGDGYCSTGSQRPAFGLVFGPQDRKTADYLLPVFNRFVGEHTLAPSKTLHLSTQSTGVMQVGSTAQGALQVLVEDHGVHPAVAPHKRFPSCVFEAPKVLQAAFLGALFSADGTIFLRSSDQENKPFLLVRLTSTSPQLLSDTQLLLFDFGIRSSITWTHPEGRKNPQGTLSIHGHHAYKFCQMIGFPLSVQKAAIAQEALDRPYGGNNYAGRRAVVEQVEEDGEDEVYDISEPVTHSMIAEGMIIHNCNLASLNLMKFLKDDSGFDTVAFKHAVDLSITAQDILVDNSSYPTAEITANAKTFRELGLGYANLGALLMSLGLPYDSEAGRQYAGAITALMTGEAYLQSARLAEPMRPFSGYAVNREPMLGVIDKHRSSAHKLDPSLVPLELLSEARKVWDETLTLGRKVGYRNSQATVLAPTGTIAFMMDCDTTGVEPDIALVKYKRLVGGGLLKIVNNTVPRALKRLGYDSKEVQAMVEYIDEHETIEGAPLLRDEHLPVFDCAFKPTRGSRSIHYLGHLRMMGAVQPFISGAISKTINMPNDATVEDISEAYMEAWRLGLKAVAIYRDGCKKVQPLATGEKKTEAPPVVVVEPTPIRRRLPMERTAICHKFDIAGHEGYIHVGFYEDGTPGEIFIKMAKEGSTISGLMDTIATLTSLALQYGVPLEALVSKFSHVRFEPSGFTKNPDIPYAKSLTDYIFRFLGTRFLSTVQKQEAGLVEGNEQRPVADESQMSPRRAPDLPWTGPRLASDRPLTLWQSQADAPSCADCGSIMIRNGSCYKCLNCGATSGCS
jgi:ribonucleoside-diphosphate reductase alpha chain